jgi:hypothetical protein
MDGIELVTTALTAGAAAGARDTASSAVRDAYSTLKDLVRRCLAGRQAGEVALAEHEQDPEVWEAPLRAQLRAAGAGDDANVTAAAQALMALLDTAGSRSGRYVITVTGSQGVQVGDGNIQHNNFGPPPPRR